MSEITVRPANPDDERERLTRKAIMWSAWRNTYTHIYSEIVIDGVFNGALKQSASWAAQRKVPFEHLIAERRNEIVGFIGNCKLNTHTDIAEVTHLYVAPVVHGIGVGWALWRAALDQLHAEGYEKAEVWVLARTPAVDLFTRQNCLPYAEGTFTVGAQVEVALGMRVSTATA